MTYPAMPTYVRGLLQSLPEVGAAWPISEREKWCAAAMAYFDLVYKADTTTEGGDE